LSRIAYGPPKKKTKKDMLELRHHTQHPYPARTATSASVHASGVQKADMPFDSLVVVVFVAADQSGSTDNGLR